MKSERGMNIPHFYGEKIRDANSSTTFRRDVVYSSAFGKEVALYVCGHCGAKYEKAPSGERCPLCRARIVED